jgi:hypothetical protein
VFFAIPLATVIAAVLHAWPTPAASRPDQDVSAPEAS